MAKEKSIDFFQEELKDYFEFNKNFNRISSIQKANNNEHEVYLTEIKSDYRNYAQDGSIIIKELSAQQAGIYQQISVLWNPYLETIYGVLEKEGRYISFNEFVKAPNSLRWPNRSLNLEEYILNFGCFSEKDALILLWQLCEGIKVLQKIHLTHGDIAPQNILLTDTCRWEKFSSPFSATSGKISVKLIDFGISREKKNRNHVVTAVIGTKPFAAPEILDFRHPTDRIDIYSLGCVLHYMLTGKSPKEIDITPSKEHISRGLYHIIVHCTASYEKRYHNISKLQKEIIYQYRCSTNIMYMLLSYIPGLKSTHPLKHIIVFIFFTFFIFLHSPSLGIYVKTRSINMDQQIKNIIHKQQKHELLKNTDYFGMLHMGRKNKMQAVFYLGELRKTKIRILFIKFLHFIHVSFLCVYTVFFLLLGLNLIFENYTPSDSDQQIEEKYKESPRGHAELAIEAGDYDTAKQILDDTLAEYPDAWIYDTYAELYIAMGENDKAVTILTDVINNRFHVENIPSTENRFYKILKEIPPESLTTTKAEYQKCLADCETYIEKYNTISELIEQESYYLALQICDELKADGAYDFYLYWYYYKCYIGLKAYSECESYLKSLYGKSTSVTDIRYPDDSSIDYALEELKKITQEN